MDKNSKRSIKTSNYNKRQSYFKETYTNEIKYGVYINGWKYLILFKTLFDENELDLINDLICSKDYDNYLIAKAIIDNKNG